MCDKKSGSGLFVWPEGPMYHGSFLNDMAEGKGKIAFTSNSTNTSNHAGVGPVTPKEPVLFEEYWVKGVAIRILSTHSIPNLLDPRKLIPGDMVQLLSQLFFLVLPSMVNSLRPF